MSFLASVPGLASVLGLALALAIVAPLHWLLFVDLLASVFQTRVNVGGVLVNANDIVMGCLVGGLCLRARIGKLALRVPYFWLWLLIGVLMSVSYVSAPYNEQYLTGPLQVVYQLYRYIWAAWLVYPLTVLLLNRPDRVRAFMVVVCLVGALVAIQAIPGGYSGDRGGPLLSSNALSMSLHFPFMLALTLVLNARSAKVRVVSVLLLILLGRAITFSYSRGGMIGDIAGALVLLALMTKFRASRRRMRSVAIVALLGLATLLLAVPDIMERPTVRRLLSVSEGGDESGTLSWRVERRWPRFWAIAMERPWLGHVSEVDPTIVGGAHTPHNGYLSLLVRWGFPVLILTVVFLGIGLRNCVRLTRSESVHPVYKLFATATIGSLAALLVHCIVDNGFGMAFPMRLLWMSVGLAIAGVQRQAVEKEFPIQSMEAGFQTSLPDPGLEGARSRA